jgi:hypothetical protein
LQTLALRQSEGGVRYFFVEGFGGLGEAHGKGSVFGVAESGVGERFEPDRDIHNTQGAIAGEGHGPVFFQHRLACGRKPREDARWPSGADVETDWECQARSRGRWEEKGDRHLYGEVSVPLA